MKTVLIFVSTLDGKVTKWGDPHVKSWSSQADKDYFKKIWNDTRLIVMGSNTFNAEPVQPSSSHLFIVMTRDPSKYTKSEVPGRLEFTKESPAQLYDRFEKEGHELMLVVGGANIATSFFKKQLIDELWLTIEPKIFGSGGSFVTGEKLEINLRLIGYEKANEEGTLITKYAVLKSGN